MPSHENALRGCELLREMLRLGWMGTDPEAAHAILDVCEFVEADSALQDYAHATNGVCGRVILPGDDDRATDAI